MMRQICKQILTLIRRTGLSVLLVAAMALPLPAGAVSGGGATIYVVDPLTGVALNGYDPVSYFTGDQPVTGRPEFELVWGGVSWFFANGANRDVFLRAPDVYAPQFGGHGTMGLARGYLSDGNPLVYAVIANRLFLFYSTANRDAFMQAQRSSYERAAQNWEFLSADLLAGDDEIPLEDEVQIGPVIEPLENLEGAPVSEESGAGDMNGDAMGTDAASGMETPAAGMEGEMSMDAPAEANAPPSAPAAQ